VNTLGYKDSQDSYKYNDDNNALISKNAQNIRDN